MIRVYVPFKVKKVKRQDGSIVESYAGPKRGVIVAQEEEDTTNVFVGYSILHKMDMTDKQKKYGLDRNEKNNAVCRALSHEFDFSDLSKHHNLIQKMMPAFLKRVAMAFPNAKTINNVDITPYKPTNEKRQEACEKITDILCAVRNGIDKLAERFDEYSKDTSNDCNKSLALDTNCLVNITRLIHFRTNQYVNVIRHSIPKNDRNSIDTTIIANLESAMIEVFGDIAKR